MASQSSASAGQHNKARQRKERLGTASHRIGQDGRAMHRQDGRAMHRISVARYGMAVKHRNAAQRKAAAGVAKARIGMAVRQSTAWQRSAAQRRAP